MIGLKIENNCQRTVIYENAFVAINKQLNKILLHVDSFKPTLKVLYDARIHQNSGHGPRGALQRVLTEQPPYFFSIGELSNNGPIKFQMKNENPSARKFTADYARTVVPTANRP